MSRMLAKIFTIDSLEVKEVAENFFKSLELQQLSPQKIGEYEPLKLDYTLEGAVNMWTQEGDGCYVEGIGMTGKAGGMIGKTKEPQFRFDMNWWRCPHKTYVNYIHFFFPVKTFKKYQGNIESLFRETISITKAIYGYITHYVPLDRQHVTGTLETRMPGVFWCNYFGQQYIEFFTEEKMLSFPWYKIERLDNGGIMAYLASEPDKELVKSDVLENQAKAHLGKDAFGDIEMYKANPDELQVRNVPRLMTNQVI